MKSDIIDQLFSQYYNEALLYSISLCKNRTVAEDIVSNAFFKALGMADDSIRDFKPWLLTVCRNEFISLCRKESRFTGEDIPEDYIDMQVFLWGIVSLNMLPAQHLMYPPHLLFCFFAKLNRYK